MACGLGYGMLLMGSAPRSIWARSALARAFKDTHPALAGFRRASIRRIAAHRAHARKIGNNPFVHRMLFAAIQAFGRIEPRRAVRTDRPRRECVKPLAASSALPVR